MCPATEPVAWWDVLPIQPERLMSRWRRLVELESGSREAVGIEAVADAMGAWLAAAGFEVRREGRTHAGASHLVASRPGSGPHLLLLGHLDTVWPPGTLVTFPFALKAGAVQGPGAADMKGGLAVLLEALEIAGASPPLSVVLTADEELGTPTGRAIVERVAAGCAACLVFEAGRPGGELVNRRRAVAVFELFVEGRTAHVAHDPERGVNAIDELAYQLLALRRMRAPQRGVSVMAGVVAGGTARQIVPDRARALIDVRAPTQTAMDRAIGRLERATARTHVPEAHVRLVGGQTRPPMVPLAATARLGTLITEVAQDGGGEIAFAQAGGGSDGCFTAALGVPTIDGFGPPGHDLCSLRERASVAGAESRARLVAGILERFAAPGFRLEGR